MKKFKRALAVFLTAVMAVSLISGCGGKKVSKEDAEYMAGKWDAVAYEMYGVIMFADDIDTHMSLDFHDNGKVTYTLDGETEDYKWEKDGNLGTLWVKEGMVSKGHTMDFYDDYFKMYWDVDGVNVNMIYVKEGSEAMSSRSYLDEDDITSEMIQNAETAEDMLTILDRLSDEAIEAFGLSDTYSQLKELEGRE